MVQSKGIWLSEPSRSQCSSSIQPPLRDAKKLLEPYSFFRPCASETLSSKILAQLSWSILELSRDLHFISWWADLAHYSASVVQRCGPVPHSLPKKVACLALGAWLQRVVFTAGETAACTQGGIPVNIWITYRILSLLLPITKSPSLPYFK